MNAVDGDLFSFRVLNAEIEPELHHMTTIIAIITLAITTKEELFHTAIPSLDILPLEKLVWLRNFCTPMAL